MGLGVDSEFDGVLILILIFCYGFWAGFDFLLWISDILDSNFGFRFVGLWLDFGLRLVGLWILDSYLLVWVGVVVILVDGVWSLWVCYCYVHLCLLCWFDLK